MLVPNSQDNARQAELQPRNMSCTLGGCLFPHHHREGIERIPGLGLDFARLSPLYRNVLILCHFEQSFCHKKGNSIACCLQNLESHDKDLKREAEYSALLIYSHDRPQIVQSVENWHTINQFLRLCNVNSLLMAISRVKAAIFLVLHLNQMAVTNKKSVYIFTYPIQHLSAWRIPDHIIQHPLYQHCQNTATFETGLEEQKGMLLTQFCCIFEQL